MQRMVGPWQHGFMKTSAARSHGTRRLGPALESALRAGQALLRVTPVAHNGCKKWVQRFGLYPMQLNLHPDYRTLHLRGIYLRVVEEGRVRVGDRVRVVSRGEA